MDENIGNAPESHTPRPDAGHSLISANNQELLKLLKKSSSENVKLIYVDPCLTPACRPA